MERGIERGIKRVIERGIERGNRNTRPFEEGKEFFELLEKKCL